MRKVMIVVLVLLMSAFVVACAEKPGDMSKSPDVSQKMKFHQDMETKNSPPKISAVDALKKNSLAGYPQKTIGAAFDGYGKVAAKEWREELGKDGKYYVDYFGWFPESAVTQAAKSAGVVKQGLNIKFVIQEDGTTYVTLGSKLALMAGGNVRSDVVPLPDVVKILDLIYADRALTF